MKAEPYLYFIYPIYLIILIACSVFLGWVGWKRRNLKPLFLSRGSIFFVIISILIYILRVSWVNIREFNSLYISNTMLAVNDQLIWHMSKTGRSFSPMYGVNYFFGHFKPILYFFVLLYKIRPGPETLLFVQTLFLGAGAMPVYLIAKKKFFPAHGTSAHGHYGFIFTLVYLFIMTLISYVSFHTVIIAIPFFLWAIYFMERGSARMSFLFCGLALACKENVSCLIFALGVYILIFRRDLKIRKSLGYSLIILSLLWFYVTIYIIMPVFAAESRTEFLKEVNAIYSYLDPGALLKTVFSFDRILYLFFLFLPFGFLPLFSPLSLVALPEILINLLSSNPAQVRIFNYYSGIILAIFLAASIEVVSRKKWLSPYLLSCSFLTLIFFGPSPEYNVDRHSQVGREFLKAIPQDASVYSQVGLASHLSQRERLNIYLADYNYNKNKKFDLKDYEYAVLDLKGDKFPDASLYKGQYFARLKELIDEEGMGLIKKEDGFILLKQHSPLNNLMRWRDIFIEEEPVTAPLLYAGKDIGLVEAKFPSRSKQGDLFWLEFGLVKLKDFSEKREIQIEFRGRRQSLVLFPKVAHDILNLSYWREGELLRHIETVRFSPFLWPGIYEIYFKIREKYEQFHIFPSHFSDESQGPADKSAIKIGEVLIKRRNFI